MYIIRVTKLISILLYKLDIYSLYSPLDLFIFIVMVLTFNPCDFNLQNNDISIIN